MATIKRDATKQQWEQTEFPLVCETCLGDNPYLRMTSEPHGKKCKICEIPFTVFAWQAGTKGRWKRVEICRSCAKAKNVCQVCIYDLEFGLPVAVRDKVLREEGGGGGGGSSAMMMANYVPQSDANRAWYNAQQNRLIENNNGNNDGQHQLSLVSSKVQAKLQSMARMEPRYERNLPKLCSFYAKGECNRGSKCPFRHEMPRDRNDPLSQQNTKDRFYGTNDPVAAKMIWKNKQIEEQKSGGTKAGGGSGATDEGDDRAVATCYVRFDTRDETTQHVQITEQDLRDQFYSHGEIVSVRMHQDSGAFIEYTTGDSAELAIITMNNKVINGRKILVNWARQAKRGNQNMSQQQDAKQGSIQGPIQPKAPPGAGISTSASSNTTTGRPTCLPVGFTPSAQVAAAIKSRAVANSGLALTGLVVDQNSNNSNSNSNRSISTSSNLPKPAGGGGVIRRIGASGLRNAAPKAKPYYPSADPNRLGTQRAGGGATGTSTAK